LTYNHYLGESKYFEVEPDRNLANSTIGVKGSFETKWLDENIINGYDGFGGVHDNLIFIP
jgi:hypothetical protein